MRHLGIVAAACLTAGCGHHDVAAPRQPTTARCTVRIVESGLLVDGEHMSRREAVTYCKAAEGGAVVVSEHPGPTQTRDEIELLLEREGVRVYVRGRECSHPDPTACRPIRPTSPKATGP